MVYLCTYVYICTTAARLQSLNSQCLHPSPLKTTFCKSLQAVTCPCKATCQKGRVSSPKHDVYIYMYTYVYVLTYWCAHPDTILYLRHDIMYIYRAGGLT